MDNSVLHAHEALGRTSGEFLGKQLMAREFCIYVEPHWPNQRVKAVATGMGESHLRVGAYNDNYDHNGVKVSRDCGVFEDNINDNLIGTDIERKLRTESLFKEDWEPVVKYNVRWFYGLWATKNVIRDGKLDYRRWNPSVAYTSGWVTNPMLYAWHHDIQGNPVGPWVVTGRYLHMAIRGVANYDHIIMNRTDATQALAWANYQASEWGIPETWCKWAYSKEKGVYFVPGPKPTQPPTAHKNWGYPVRNDGR